MSNAMNNRIIEMKTVSVDSLIDNPLNWRIHTDDQLRALEAAVNTIGITNPIRCVEIEIEVDEFEDQLKTGYQIVDGHARKDILMKAGIKEVPILVLNLNEDEVRIALSTDDAIAMMAETDLSARAVLADLIEQDVSDDLLRVINLTGIEAEEISQLVIPDDEEFNPEAIFVISFETTSPGKRDEVVSLLQEAGIEAVVTVKR